MFDCSKDMVDSNSTRPTKRSWLGRCLGREISSDAEANGTEGKQKAANFPASLLRIGAWEYARKYSSDLKSKCYFCRKKLIWEIIDDDSIKKKMEIDWDDITALRDSYDDDGRGFLDLAVAKPPKFFMEHNVQARKHTSWKECPDFTDNQASMYRVHLLEYSDGSDLSYMFERLISHDPRLKFLSYQQDFPYFIRQDALFDRRGDGENSASRPVDVVNLGALTVSAPNSSLPAALLPGSSNENIDAADQSSGLGVSSYSAGLPCVLPGTDAAAPRSTDYYDNIMTEGGGGPEMDEGWLCIDNKDEIINNPDNSYAVGVLGGATKRLRLDPAVLQLPLPAPCEGGCGFGSEWSDCPQFSDESYHSSYAATVAATSNSGEESSSLDWLLENNDAGGEGEEGWWSAMDDWFLNVVPQSSAAGNSAAANGASASATAAANGAFASANGASASVTAAADDDDEEWKEYLK